ncbi:polysaccharide biosynthesis/export family protein [Desulfobacterales bacterium HSG16]|nr:polysaccharide biosynthesis/export family protein [Desulfobacterales bacterium HSG16]
MKNRYLLKNPGVKKIFLLIFLISGICHAAEPQKADTDIQDARNEVLAEASYLIGAGDKLEIITWKEKDFTREVSVRTDGKFSFPLLDDVRAVGKTPMEVKKDITERLQKFVKDPIVTVVVKDPQSQKFYILGEVGTAGEFPLIRKITVLQAIALAGGFNEWAGKKYVMLIRQHKDRQEIIRINYRNIVKGRDFDQNITIRADDTIIVP